MTTDNIDRVENCILEDRRVTVPDIAGEFEPQCQFCRENYLWKSISRLPYRFQNNWRMIGNNSDMMSVRAWLVVIIEKDHFLIELLLATRYGYIITHQTSNVRQCNVSTWLPLLQRSSAICVEDYYLCLLGQLGTNSCGFYTSWIAVNANYYSSLNVSTHCIKEQHYGCGTFH